MKKLIAALMGKVENTKVERKVNRVNRAIDTVIDNAKDAIDRIEEEKDALLECLIDAPEVNSIISRLSDKIDEQEQQEAIIARAKKVKDYLNKDVAVDEE